MPDAVSFKVVTYRKLAKGEHGITQIASRRIPLADALGWILDELPDEAWDVEHEAPAAGSEREAVTLRIDWSKVPGSVRNPDLPARRR